MDHSNRTSLRSQLVQLATMITTACMSSAAISCAAPVGAESTVDDAPPALYQAGPIGPFAEVTANGTGCPAGTWTSSVSEDGTTFEVAFSAYEASVSPGSSFSIKDCLLGIKLASDPGVQFAVESLAYHGVASLGPGVRTTLSANYYFQGEPASPDQELTTDLTGPVAQSFDIYDAPAFEELGWSPCGAQRDLNVTTRIVLRNAPGATASGNVSINAAEGSSKLFIRVASRGC